MSVVLNPLKHFVKPPKVAVNVLRQTTVRLFTHYTEGDRVLIAGKKLSNPLRPGGTINVAKGQIQHDDILGKPLTRLRVTSNRGQASTVTYPTFDEYVSNTPRVVTPVCISLRTNEHILIDLQ